jgi:hypothetical protein
MRGEAIPIRSWRSTHAPAGSRSTARAATGLRGFEKRPPLEKRCHARLPRGRVQPSSRFQAQRSRLSHDGGKRARMQSLLHDAQDLVVLPAIDPDDALSVEAEAGEAGQIAIGAARSPKRVSFPDAQNPGRYRCSKRRHRGRKFGFKPIGPELVKRAKLEAAMGKGRVQPAILERQNLIALARFQVVPFKGTDLHP